MFFFVVENVFDQNTKLVILWRHLGRNPGFPGECFELTKLSNGGSLDVSLHLSFDL